VVSADGAVVDNDVPGPKGDSIPLLDLETLLPFTLAFAFCALGLLRDRTGAAWRIDHVHVGHLGLPCDAPEV